MPRLSILIPCLGGAAEFDAALVSVLQNRPPDCEIIVAHTVPYDDPYDLAGDVCFVEHRASNLVELINAALPHASGDIVHILGADREAVEGWTGPALAHFHDPEVAAVAPIVLANDGQLASAGIRFSLGGARHIVRDQRVIQPGAARHRKRILGPELTCAFYRRDVLIALNGLDTAAGDDLADVDLALAIHALGGLFICEPASEVKLAAESSPRYGFLAGRRAERVFWRYARQRGLALSLLLHPLTLGFQFAQLLPRLAAFTSLLGRVTALFDFGATSRQQERLLAARETLAQITSQRAILTLPKERKKQPIPAATRRRAA